MAKMKTPLKNHEQTFNAALGAVLQTRRRSWKNRVATEMSGSIQGGGRADNLIYPDDMQPVAVEAAFVSETGAKTDIDKDAIDRLGRLDGKNKMEIMTAVAVAIPASVKALKGGVDGIKKWLQKGGELQYAAYSLVLGESHEMPPSGFDIRYPDGKPNSGYIRGTAGDLADLIELAATPDKKIKDAAAKAGGAVYATGASMHRVLPDFVRESIAKKVGQPPDAHAMRVAACVWLNATVLHGKLSAARKDVVSPRECKELHETLDAWADILKIDYKSVFRPALESLELLSDHGAKAYYFLKQLRSVADKLGELRLGAVADVSSDMFPELVDPKDRKTTAAFYTRMEAAELLAGLAFNLIPDDGRDIKIADFACGTGALLKAAYRRVRRRAETKPEIDMAELHKKYMEECLHGADIQPIASHLTAAGLAGMHPSADYDNSNIICTDIRDGKTGSMDLLKNKSLEDLFLVSSGVAADGSRTDRFRPADGTFDLCIMNPPYSRTRGESKSRGGGKVFGVEGLPQYQREKSLGNLGKSLSGSFANKKAGMASAFCLLADRKLKPGGVLAAVLPLSAAGQHSWRAFRAHIVKKYSDIIVVSMATEKLQPFSADTGMAEMLICARKGGKPNGEIAFLNLLNFPRTFIESNEMARMARGVISPRTLASGEVGIGAHIFASCFRTKYDGAESWGSVGVKSAEMARIGQCMAEGELVTADLARKHSLLPAMKTFSAHAETGPTHHLIGHLQGKTPIGAFVFRELRQSDSVNLSLWAANHKTQRRLICEPTHRGEAAWTKENIVDGFMRRENIGEAESQKNLCALADAMIEKQSTLFVARSLSMASQTLAAAMTEKPCMGGSAWNAILCDAKTRAAYCLWFNSVPGLIARWQCGGRQHPGRVRMQIGGIGAMPCPAFSGSDAAAKRAVKIANEEFSRLAKLDLMPCAYAWRDESRKEIDRVVLRMLGLGEDVSEKDAKTLRGGRKAVNEDSMQALREQWCREPSVHGGNKQILKCLHADNIA